MSRVIRGGGGPRSVVPREVYDAGEEAKRILDDARARAEQIVADAESEAHRIRETARREAHEAGRADAATVLAEAAATRDRALAEADRQIAQIALAVAARIVGAELDREPERIGAMVAALLDRARRANDVTLVVHPDDAATLRAMQSELVDRAGRPARFTIAEDATLTRGGCLVRTDLGQLDARIEVQLEALARALGL